MRKGSQAILNHYRLPQPSDAKRTTINPNPAQPFADPSYPPRGEGGQRFAKQSSESRSDRYKNPPSASNTAPIQPRSTTSSPSSAPKFQATMGEKLTKDPLTSVEVSPGRSSGQQDTHDAISIDRISATNGARPLDPASEEYKLMEKKLGIITVVIGVCAVFILPDMPGNSKFLTPEERQMAVNRLCLDAGSSLSPNDEEGTAVQGFIMAVKDIKVWVLAFMLIAVTVGVGFNQFFPTIVGSLGYSKTVTLLLTAPIWFFAFLACLANGLHSDRTQERSLHIIIPLVFGIVGFIIASTTTGLGPRFFALFIQASSYAGYTCVLGWIAPSIPTPKYKKAVALALINAFSQLGNISASYVWPKKWGPKYWQSNTISAAMFVACIALVLLHRTMLSMENKELDRIKADVLAKGGSGGLEKEVLEGKADEESGKAVDAKSKKAQTRIAMAKSSFRYML
ncbi:hypothetical protein NDA13_003025 [Ustilago tritici]|nr:hypothetical protein NDA13_003025 [Ustilago tritici]